MSRLLHLITVFALLASWSGHALALGPVGGGAVNADAWQHAVMHWSDQAHHHHGDQIQVDGSDESVAHVLGDHGSCGVALVATAPSLQHPCPQTGVAGPHPAAAPPPFLEGLLRPPRG
jgi:hypothetical protein